MEPSPLVVWKMLLIVIVFATIAMLVADDPMKTVVRRSDGVLAQRISQLHFADDETGIIFFGNSLLNQALPVRNETLTWLINNEFRKYGHPGKYVPVEITTGGVNAWRLQALGNQLIDAKPSVIVIQSEMFISRKREKGFNLQLTNRIAAWSGVLNLRFFGRVQNTGNPKVQGGQFPGIEKPGTNTVRRRQVQDDQTLAVAKDLWENQVASPDTPEFIASQKFVKRVLERGIRVVVVELPVSQTAAKFATSEYFAKRTQAIEELTNFGVIHLAYPRILPDDDFRDFSHLGTRGRRDFIRWFIPALTQALLKNEVIQ
jgi:hypothetical protein